MPSTGSWHFACMLTALAAMHVPHVVRGWSCNPGDVFRGSPVDIADWNVTMVGCSFVQIQTTVTLQAPPSASAGVAPPPSTTSGTDNNGTATVAPPPGAGDPSHVTLIIVNCSFEAGASIIITLGTADTEFPTSTMVFIGNSTFVGAGVLVRFGSASALPNWNPSRPTCDNPAPTVRSGQHDSADDGRSRYTVVEYPPAAATWIVFQGLTITNGTIQLYLVTLHAGSGVWFDRAYVNRDSPQSWPSPAVDIVDGSWADSTVCVSDSFLRGSYGFVARTCPIMYNVAVVVNRSQFYGDGKTGDGFAIIAGQIGGFFGLALIRGPLGLVSIDASVVVVGGLQVGVTEGAIMDVRCAAVVGNLRVGGGGGLVVALPRTMLPPSDIISFTDVTIQAVAVHWTRLTVASEFTFSKAIVNNSYFVVDDGDISATVLFDEVKIYNSSFVWTQSRLVALNTTAVQTAAVDVAYPVVVNASFIFINCFIFVPHVIGILFRGQYYMYGAVLRIIGNTTIVALESQAVWVISTPPIRRSFFDMATVQSFFVAATANITGDISVHTAGDGAIELELASIRGNLELSGDGNGHVARFDVSDVQGNVTLRGLLFVGRSVLEVDTATVPNSPLHSEVQDSSNESSSSSPALLLLAPMELSVRDSIVLSNCHFVNASIAFFNSAPTSTDEKVLVYSVVFINSTFVLDNVSITADVSGGVNGLDVVQSYFYGSTMCVANCRFVGLYGVVFRSSVIAYTVLTFTNTTMQGTSANAAFALLPTATSAAYYGSTSFFGDTSLLLIDVTNTLIGPVVAGAAQWATIAIECNVTEGLTVQCLDLTGRVAALPALVGTHHDTTPTFVNGSLTISMCTVAQRFIAVSVINGSVILFRLTIDNATFHIVNSVLAVNTSLDVTSTVVYFGAFAIVNCTVANFLPDMYAVSVYQSTLVNSVFIVRASQLVGGMFGIVFRSSTASASSIVIDENTYLSGAAYAALAILSSFIVAGYDSSTFASCYVYVARDVALRGTVIVYVKSASVVDIRCAEIDGSLDIVGDGGPSVANIPSIIRSAVTIRSMTFGLPHGTIAIRTGSQLLLQDVSCYNATIVIANVNYSSMQLHTVTLNLCRFFVVNATVVAPNSSTTPAIDINVPYWQASSTVCFCNVTAVGAPALVIRNAGVIRDTRVVFCGSATSIVDAGGSGRAIDVLYERYGLNWDAVSFTTGSVLALLQGRFVGAIMASFYGSCAFVVNVASVTFSASVDSLAPFMPIPPSSQLSIVGDVTSTVVLNNGGAHNASEWSFSPAMISSNYLSDNFNVKAAWLVCDACAAVVVDRSIDEDYSPPLARWNAPARAVDGASVCMRAVEEAVPTRIRSSLQPTTSLGLTVTSMTTVIVLSSSSPSSSTNTPTGVVSDPSVSTADVLSTRSITRNGGGATTSVTPSIGPSTPTPRQDGIHNATSTSLVAPTMASSTTAPASSVVGLAGLKSEVAQSTREAATVSVSAVGILGTAFVRLSAGSQVTVASRMNELYSICKSSSSASALDITDQDLLVSIVGFNVDSRGGPAVGALLSVLLVQVVVACSLILTAVVRGVRASTTSSGPTQRGPSGYDVPLLVMREGGQSSEIPKTDDEAHKPIDELSHPTSPPAWVRALRSLHAVSVMFFSPNMAALALISLRATDATLLTGLAAAAMVVNVVVFVATGMVVVVTTTALLPPPERLRVTAADTSLFVRALRESVKEIHAPFMEDSRDVCVFRYRVLCVEDLTVAWCAALVAGIGSWTLASCEAVAAFMAVLYAAHIAYIVVVRPHAEGRGTLMAALGAVANGGVVLLTAVALLWRPTDAPTQQALLTAVDAASVASSWAQVGLVALELVFVARDACRGGNDESDLQRSTARVAAADGEEPNGSGDDREEDRADSSKHSSPISDAAGSLVVGVADESHPLPFRRGGGGGERVVAAKGSSSIVGDGLLGPPGAAVARRNAVGSVVNPLLTVS